MNKSLTRYEYAIADLITAACDIKRDYHERKRYVEITHDNLTRLLQALEGVLKCE